MIQVRCPTCGRRMQGESTSQWPQFPFCGPRCRLIDLGRWLQEDYRILHPPEVEGDPPAQTAQSEIP